MPVERGAYLGPRLRRLRRELGLTQPGMAADLAVSVSYVSLLESNQRPLTADMLLRIARTYKIDMAAFAGDGGIEFTTRLQTMLKDPLFADIDIPPLQAADVATNYPGIAEALLRLYTAYGEEQRLLADQAPGSDYEKDEAPQAGAEVRRLLGDLELGPQVLRLCRRGVAPLDRLAEGKRVRGGIELNEYLAHGDVLTEREARVDDAA